MMMIANAHRLTEHSTINVNTDRISKVCIVPYLVLHHLPNLGAKGYVQLKNNYSQL